MGHSYTIQVRKTGRLFTCNTKHIQGTAILSRAVLVGPDTKAMGQLEDLFMQAVPVETDTLPKLVGPEAKEEKKHIIGLQLMRKGKNGVIQPLQQGTGNSDECIGTVCLPPDRSLRPVAGTMTMIRSQTVLL